MWKPRISPIHQTYDFVYQQSFIMNQLNSEVNWQLKEQGINLQVLAGRIGISRTKLVVWLSSDTDLSVRRLAAISAALGVDLNVNMVVTKRSIASSGRSA